MLSKITLIAAALAISDVSGRYFYWGSCPTFEETNALVDIDMERFAGKWYSM
jgi:hypothetical protein